MKIDAFSFTSPGGREYNEDSIGEKTADNGVLYVLADGLGGHLHGEQASSCAVDTILASLNWEEPPLTALQRAMDKANEAILTLQEESRSKMKSTAVCLLVQNGQAFWTHVGDSRLYYVHDGTLCAVTADHSVAYKKYLSGEITRRQIATDEDQASLLRALGTPDRNQGDFGSSSGPLSPGDGFLLCSDGFWEYLRDQEIVVDMLKSETAQHWAQLLLLRVMERIGPGNDNLSVITVRMNA